MVMLFTLPRERKQYAYMFVFAGDGCSMNMFVIIDMLSLEERTNDMVDDGDEWTKMMMMMIWMNMMVMVVDGTK